MGTYDYSSGTWVRATDEFRKSHYKSYNEAHRGLIRRMNSFRNDDDCWNGPKPPGFEDFWKLGEYFLGKTLDGAAKDLSDGADWTKAVVFQKEVAAALALAATAAAVVSVAPPSWWRPENWACPNPGGPIKITGCP
jgi:hypothetical protein